MVDHLAHKLQQRVVGTLILPFGFYDRPHRLLDFVGEPMVYRFVCLLHPNFYLFLYILAVLLQNLYVILSNFIFLIEKLVSVDLGVDHLTFFHSILYIVF